MNQYTIDIDASNKLIEKYNEDVKTCKTVAQKNESLDTKNEIFKQFMTENWRNSKKPKISTNLNKNNALKQRMSTMTQNKSTNKGIERKKAKKQIQIKWQL